MKYVTGNLEQGFHVFHFFRNQACLRFEIGYFQNLLKHVVRYNTYYTLCKEITIFKLSVCLGELQLNSM